MSLISPATVIDVTRLPPPQAIKPLDYDAIVVERGELLKARYDANGVAYDVDKLETDAGMILEQVDAYRELLDKAAINDAVRAVLPAFARGSDLDHIAARANVTRLVVQPADPETGAAPVYESDAQLLRRYLAAFAAPAAGSEDGYIYHAATAWPEARDIRPLDYTAGTGLAPGQIEVVLLAEDGAEVPAAAITAVVRAMRPKRNRPMTDIVSVRAADIVSWQAAAHLIIPRGPDPSLIVAAARANVEALGRARYFIGGEVPANAVPSAVYVPNVIRAVVTAPLADVPHGPDKAPYLTHIDITYEVRP